MERRCSGFSAYAGPVTEPGQRSRTAEMAAHPEQARAAGISLDEPMRYLVADGVLPMLQLAVLVQNGELDRPS
jgi:hypothetical protein